MENNLELIEKYFSDSLSDDEQILFNHLLKNNDAFKEEFLFQKDIKKALSANQRNSLKLTLQNFENELKKRKVFHLKKWLAAASIILVLGFSYFIIQNSFKNSPQELYSQNFEPYRNVVYPVVRGKVEKTIESRAFLAYENKKYHKALNLFNSVENKEDEYIRFYSAMCYMGVNKNLEAIDLLLPIATEPSDKVSKVNFNEKANWYLGLAYLNSGNIDKAKNQFSIIASNPYFSFKKKEAKKILSKLE